MLIVRPGTLIINILWYYDPNLLNLFVAFMRKIIMGSGVSYCFWLNLSSDLILHKSCLNFWPKSQISLKSETAPHPRSQFCTCHDSWAVMACAKLWPNWIIIEIRTKRVCAQFRLCAHKLFVIYISLIVQWITFIVFTIVEMWSESRWHHTSKMCFRMVTSIEMDMKVMNIN